MGKIAKAIGFSGMEDSEEDPMSEDTEMKPAKSPDAEVLAMKQFERASSPEAKVAAMKSFLEACGVY